MVSTTKKIGPAGRFGARYGSLARKQVATVERVQRRKHICNRCGAHAVARLHTGIWQCRKCDHQFAGGAYLPQTGAGRGARKALRGISDRLIRGAAMEEEISFHALAEQEEDDLAEYESYEEKLEAAEEELEATEAGAVPAEEPAPESEDSTDASKEGASEEPGGESVEGASEEETDEDES